MNEKAQVLKRFVRMLSVPLILVLSMTAFSQSTATLQGSVTDPSGAAVAGAKITVKSVATGVERTTEADGAGNYLVASLPNGVYRIEVQAQGFQSQVVETLTLEVSQTVQRNFQLKVGEVTQQVTVTAEAPVVEAGTTTVGQVINDRTVQDIPLNG
ncbi:MAG: carboxypeptidase-like regulatory domain-containing protein, partial [Blastocatellia bacterium]